MREADIRGSLSLHPMRPLRLLTPALFGLVALTFVCTTSARPVHPPSGDAAEDEEQHSLTLVPPDKRWRALAASELRELASDAVAGLAGAGSVRTVLRVQNELRTDLAELARERLDRERLGLASYAFLETIQVGEHAAVHALVNGKKDGSWWRHHVVVYKDEGKLVSLHSWGRSEEVPADGSAFLVATTGLRSLSAADFDELSPINHLPDRAGPGWELREGAYLDVALGLQLEPRGPWRVAFADELATTVGPDFRVGMADELHEAWIAVSVENVPGVDPQRHLGLQRQKASEVGHTAGSRRIKLAGQRVDLDLYTLPSYSGRPEDAQHMLHGAFFLGSRCVQLFVRYPASVENAIRIPLDQAFDSLTWMEEDERSATATAMLQAPRTEKVVGDSWVQRGGVFTDFTLGFEWTPSEGFWEFVSPDDRSPDGSGVQLLIRDRSLGVNGWLASQPVKRGTEAAALHTAEFERLFDGRPMGEVSELSTLELGEVQGVVSFCSPADTVTPVRYLLATALTPGRAFTVLFDATPEAMEQSRQEILTTLAGLKISGRALRRSEMKAGSYRDFRLGFELTSPEPDWLFEESAIEHFGSQARAARGVACGFEGGGGRGVFACAVWSEGLPGDVSGPIRGLLPGPFTDLARLPQAAPDLDQPAKFRGRMGRLLGWTDGERRIEVMLVIDRGTLFCIGAVSLPGDPAPRARLSGFRILD